MHLKHVSKNSKVKIQQHRHLRNYKIFDDNAFISTTNTTNLNIDFNHENSNSLRIFRFKSLCVLKFLNFLFRSSMLMSIQRVIYLFAIIKIINFHYLYDWEHFVRNILYASWLNRTLRNTIRIESSTFFEFKKIK